MDSGLKRFFIFLIILSISSLTITYILRDTLIYNDYLGEVTSKEILLVRHYDESGRYKYGHYIVEFKDSYGKIHRIDNGNYYNIDKYLGSSKKIIKALIDEGKVYSDDTDIFILSLSITVISIVSLLILSLTYWDEILTELCSKNDDPKRLKIPFRFDEKLINSIKSFFGY